MKLLNKVFLPDGNYIYVSDDIYGDERLEQLYKQYGDLTVFVYEYDKLWGVKDTSNVQPELKTTIIKLYE